MPDVNDVAALSEPTRKRVFEAVRRARRPVNRDDVARDIGISRKLAAFHLDKLLEHGLIRTHYARPPGRSGPGAGRTAKYYEPSDVQIEVTIPERRYALAGELLLDAVLSEDERRPARDTAIHVARERGETIGQAARRSRKARALGAAKALELAHELLEDYGFEPYQPRSGELALRNCPFHALATRAPEIVCGMNQAFIEGVLRGLGNTTVEAVLTCTPGECCVTMRRAR